MKKAAIDKAQKRLLKARESFKRILSSINFSEFESAWTDFLLATQGIHSALELGAMTNPQSRQWYGGKKNERRKDPLLQYLHQARNADEHGIEPIARHNPGHIGIGVGGETVHIDKLIIDGSGNMTAKFHPVDGKFPTVEFAQPRAELVTVVDSRFGDSFDPPKEHLGTAVNDSSPAGVARVGLSYYEALVEEADKLIK